MLKELIEDLKPYDKAEIAYKSGISFSTVNNIMSGRNNNPSIKAVEALRNFVNEKEQENEHVSKR